MLGDAGLVQAVLKDHTTAPISEAERTLFRFVAKVNRESNQVSLADVEEMRRAGWPDEAIYDAVTICALFNFYNRWVDAAGVQDMTALGYEMSGHRLATEGYARPDSKSTAGQGGL